MDNGFRVHKIETEQCINLLKDLIQSTYQGTENKLMMNSCIHDDTILRKDDEVTGHSSNVFLYL